MSEEDSCYSNDEQYFMDLCRGNQFEELQDFIKQLPADSQFNWGWCNYASDNFVHMIAANNLPHIFDFVMPHLVKACPRDQVLQIINKQNSSGSTPLHYAVVTDSKEMVTKLLNAGADTQLVNQHKRNPLAEAEKFQKFEVAELLAPVTKTDIDSLRKQVGDLDLNDNQSSSDEEQLPAIEEKAEDKHQQQKDENKKSQTAEQKVILTSSQVPKKQQ